MKKKKEKKKIDIIILVTLDDNISNPLGIIKTLQGDNIPLETLQLTGVIITIQQIMFFHESVITVIFLVLVIQKLMTCYNISVDINYSAEKENDVKVTESLIDTEGCKILKIDTFNDKLEPLINRINPGLKRPYCEFVDHKYKPPLVGSDKNSLFIINSSKKFYRVNSENSFECSYTPFWNIEPYVDDFVTFGKEVYFKKYIKVPYYIEFLQVSCFLEGETVYMDIHSFVPNKRDKLLKKMFSVPTQNVSTTPELSVLIFAMETLSRVNFHRQMPETQHIMNQLKFIEFFGYHRIANNTLENLVTLLTGQTLDELEHSCKLASNFAFDECPFIWKHFADSDYLTAFIEEENPFSFRDLKFNYVPTDYYYHIIQKMATTWIKHNDFKNSYLCMGPRLSTKVFIDYAQKFASSLKDEKFFAFFSELISTEDDMNLPHISDNLHANFLRFLKDVGLTEKCIIVILSYRGSGYQQAEAQDRYLEERLPLFKVAFPSWFRRKFPLAHRNFLMNTNRLTTHFDAFEMFFDLTNSEVIGNEMVKERTSLMNALNEMPRGISLFLPIPEERTCTDAGLQYYHCCCEGQNENYLSETDFAKNNGEFLVTYINSLLKGYKSCSKLSLKAVKDVKFNNYGKIKKNKMVITVVTSPGDLEFEAVIEENSENFDYWTKTIKEVKRKNYVASSHCTNNDRIQSYCSCT